MQKLTKKFGFFTALSMVIGIVVGSGVFYKAQEILITVNGNMPLGIVAWLVGGGVMLCCSATFSVMASMFEGTGGAADYAELCCSEKYAYYFSWFLATILYPSLASVLSWVSARYVGALFGWNSDSGSVMLLAGLFLIFSYVINVISPRLAGKLQISATVVKLIPLVLMSIVGTINGFSSGNIEAGSLIRVGEADQLSIFGAIVATAFAYEGWIVATSINTELRDAKKSLPRALLVGGIVIISIYTLYFIGLTGALEVGELMDKGATLAFVTLFGNGFGLLLNVFVCISCLGTLNGLTMATVRGYYVCGSRMRSSLRNPWVEVNKYTDIPTFSGTLGLMTSALWLFYFYGANVGGGWFGVFNFDSSELPVITVYGLYIPIFVGFMIKQKGMNFKKRFLLPGLSIIASIFIILATIYAHGIRPYLTAVNEGKFSFPVLFYLIIFGVIMVIGWGVKELDKRLDMKSKINITDINSRDSLENDSDE